MTAAALTVTLAVTLLSSCDRALQMYLRDSTHPNPVFMNSMFNIYLNLWHDHARRCAARSGRDSTNCPPVVGGDSD